MRHSSLWLMTSFALIASPAFVENVQAQSAVPDTPQGGVLLVKLHDPVYPRIAEAARINGAVELTLHIKRDGTVDSVDLISGHPLLQEAAIESARQSLFECRGCAEGMTAYSLEYEFQIISTDPEKYCSTLTNEAQAPELDPSRHRIAVFGRETWTCDPAVALRKIRSAKCLYLWKCGLREIEQTDYGASVLNR